MPVCKKCNRNYPSSIIIDGSRKFLHTRSYCLDCSPFGLNTGYEYRKQNTNKINDLPENQIKQCKICDKKYPTNKNNVCTTCRSEYARYIRKKELVALLGGKCKCGEDRIACLQFHHKDPSTKRFTISSIFQMKKEKLMEETKMCEILCANCHAIYHYPDKSKVIQYYQNIAK